MNQMQGLKNSAQRWPIVARSACMQCEPAIFPCPDCFQGFQEFPRQGESEDYKIKKKSGCATKIWEKPLKIINLIWVKSSKDLAG